MMETLKFGVPLTALDALSSKFPSLLRFQVNDCQYFRRQDGWVFALRGLFGG